MAYRIIDTGASGGIIVSPLNLQEGAAKVAAAENIIDVQLDAESTPDQFAMRFLNQLMISVPASHNENCWDAADGENHASL